MNKGKKLKYFILSGVVVLIILVPLLAWLQYSWLGQLSEAESVRMKSNLEVSAQRFSEDFDRSMTSVYQAFSPQENKDAQFFSTAWKNWVSNSKYPELIDSIYVIKYPNRTISCLDTVYRKFIPVDWPPFLSRYDEYFREDDDINMMRIIPLTHGPVLDSVSFILLTGDELLTNVFETPQIYILIRLNTHVITDSLLPDLVQQYFYYENELPYYVTIMREDSVFFTSENTVSSRIIVA